MPIHIVATSQLLVGRATVVEGDAPLGCYAVVFEDDGDTAYFYAMDMSVAEQPIQDAVHIYNVANVSDRTTPSVVKIAWSEDALKAVLLINDYPHAVFDFQAKRGYCRTAFPPASAAGAWSSQGHDWSDDAIALFA